VRKPSPGNLLPLKKWEVLRTITELRRFIGLTNYFSGYIQDYSRFAAPPIAKLQVGQEDGKKVSEKGVLWNQAETEGFDKLKHELAQA